jgi:hypothetical protein
VTSSKTDARVASSQIIDSSLLDASAVTPTVVIFMYKHHDNVLEQPADDLVFSSTNLGPTHQVLLFLPYMSSACVFSNTDVSGKRKL